MARSVFYYHLKRAKRAHKYAAEMEVVKEIFHEHKGRYGYRRITSEMRNRGYTINHKTVRHLMGEMGLKCRIRKVRYHSYKGDAGRVAPNIIERDFTATRPNLEQVYDMLQKAFDKFENLEGLIFHSDQGWQYQHLGYRKRLKNRHIIQSMSRKGNYYDNSMMENFFGIMKSEHTLC